MKKKKLLLLINLVFITNIHSEIFLRRIINESKNKKVSITYPWFFDCAPLKIKPKTICQLEFGSKEKPVAYIDIQLNKENFLEIKIKKQTYKLYYGKNPKLSASCICIERLDGAICRDTRSNTSEDSYLALIVTDDPKQFPRLVSLEELDSKYY